MSPPSGGPAVRPIATTVPTVPSARPRIAGGNDGGDDGRADRHHRARAERLEDARRDERAEPGRQRRTARSRA